MPRALSVFLPAPPAAFSIPSIRPTFSWLRALLLSTVLPVLSGIAAADAGIPDPLSLNQALEYAHGHPRVLLGHAGVLPRSPSLYLDCHRLAYSHISGDDSRSHPVDALLPPLVAQRLEIMGRFLDVQLADLSYGRYNEALAVAYIQYDRANIRRELGQYGELLVAELETAYQDVLRKRAGSQASQRLTRALLAQAMNRPEDLPHELEPPQLTLPPEELPELDAVLAAASERETAEADEQASNQDLADAHRRLRDMELRRQVLELLLRLEVLQTTARYAETESFMRDLKLEESRTLYEWEVKADLGYSMSRQTMARLQEEQVRYCRALGWAELNALQGRPISPQLQVETPP